MNEVLPGYEYTESALSTPLESAIDREVFDNVRRRKGRQVRSTTD